MEQLKFNEKIISKEALEKRKSALSDELLQKNEIKKIIADLDINMEEFNYYLGYFLSYHEDKEACQNCNDCSSCKKEIKGMNLKLVRKDDGSIEREYMVCPKIENQKRLYDNYLIRNFNEELLLLNVENIEKKKNRKEYEKQILKMILTSDEEYKGMYICGDSGTGKSYPLIILCNYYASINKKCAFIDVKEFLESLKNTFSFNKENYGKLMDIAKEADILTLDNLGDEKQSEWVRDDVLSTILDYRNKNKKTTFITSCYNLDELEKMYNVSKSNSETGKLKASKFVDKIKTLCPFIFEIKE